jgi:hypothetical protein
VVGVYLPYMIVDGKASADVAGRGEIETRALHPGSGDNKKTYYDADVYQVERHVDFTVDDLTLESSPSAATWTPASTPTTSSTRSCRSTPRTR